MWGSLKNLKSRLIVLEIFAVLSSIKERWLNRTSSSNDNLPRNAMDGFRVINRLDNELYDFLRSGVSLS